MRMLQYSSATESFTQPRKLIVGTPFYFDPTRRRKSLRSNEEFATEVLRFVPTLLGYQAKDETEK